MFIAKVMFKKIVSLTRTHLERLLLHNCHSANSCACFKPYQTCGMELFCKNSLRPKAMTTFGKNLHRPYLAQSFK